MISSIQDFRSRPECKLPYFGVNLETCWLLVCSPSSRTDRNLVPGATSPCRAGDEANLSCMIVRAGFKRSNLEVPADNRCARTDGATRQSVRQGLACAINSASACRPRQVRLWHTWYSFSKIAHLGQHLLVQSKCFSKLERNARHGVFVGRGWVTRKHQIVPCRECFPDQTAL